VTAEDCWLATNWSFVRAHLPPHPARVLELGCGPLGGFVPVLTTAGYEAVGVDPEAPGGANFRDVEFELYDPPEPVDTIVACTSLHHVADLDLVLDRVVAALSPGGRLVVIEWAWERFDEPTARWCFERLDTAATPTEPTWLHRHRDRWTASGQTWDDYHRDWATAEGLHTGDQILRALDARFRTDLVADGPYFACDLALTSAAPEQAAIDTGTIQATGLRYVATRGS
jgi:SAM-dependent methyltransferase